MKKSASAAFPAMNRRAAPLRDLSKRKIALLNKIDAHSVLSSRNDACVVCGIAKTLRFVTAPDMRLEAHSGVTMIGTASSDQLCT